MSTGIDIFSATIKLVQKICNVINQINELPAEIKTISKRLDFYQGELRDFKKKFNQDGPSPNIEKALEIYDDQLKRMEKCLGKIEKDDVKVAKEIGKNLMGRSTTFNKLKEIADELWRAHADLANSVTNHNFCNNDRRHQGSQSSHKVESENGDAPHAPGQNDFQWHRHHAGHSQASTKFTGELPPGYVVKTQCAKCDWPILERRRGGGDMIIDITPHAYQHDDRTVHILPGATDGCDDACKAAKKTLLDLGRSPGARPAQQGDNAKTEHAADKTDWEKEEEEAGGEDGGKPEDQRFALRERSKEAAFRQGDRDHESLKQRAVNKGLINRGFLYGTTIDDEIEGKTPLCIAAEKGQEEHVILLAQCGAKLVTSDQKGQCKKSALHYAAANGHLQVVKDIYLLLWMKGLDGKGEASQMLLHSTNRGGTALHEASKAGHLEVVLYLCSRNEGGKQLLMDKRYSVTRSGEWTALHFAASYFHLDVVKYLCWKGGRELIMAEDKNNHTAKTIAETSKEKDAEHNRQKIVDYLQSQMDSLRVR